MVDKLGGELTVDGSDLLDSWAAIRIKQLSRPSRLRGFSNKAQIVVLIAVNKWDKKNGFFINDIAMERSEDIILNGGDDILFPRPEGGLVIIFYLQSPPWYPLRRQNSLGACQTVRILPVSEERVSHIVRLVQVIRTSSVIIERVGHVVKKEIQPRALISNRSCVSLTWPLILMWLRIRPTVSRSSYLRRIHHAR